MSIDFEKVCDACFNVWVDGAERIWAKEVWEKFKADGFVEQGTSPVHRTRDCVIMIILGQIYHSFCNLAFETGEPPPIDQMAYDLEDEIDLLALGLLAARTGLDYDWTQFANESDLFEAIIEGVSLALHSSVASELSGCFENDNLLFCAMYNSREEAIYMEDKYETSPLDTVTRSNVMAYSFITDGMQ